MPSGSRYIGNFKNGLKEDYKATVIFYDESRKDNLLFQKGALKSKLNPNS